MSGKEVTATGISQPYPGLRPFTLDEVPIFHGRAQHVIDMLKRLDKTRFLAVVGGSGSGKSSLVRAGLLPALERGYLLSAGADWRFLVIKPGNDPYRNMARGIRALTEEAPDPHDIAFTDAILRTSRHSFAEALAGANDSETPDRRPVLLLVDQFEELFRFRQRSRSNTDDEDLPVHERRNEAAGFVSLVLAAAEQTDVPVHVILTMRSDFIGDCDAFEGLPGAVSGSQFLVPRLTREQMQEAIEKPLMHFGASAEPALVNRVINDAGTDPDQLPLMQHALMRTWFHAKDRWEQEGSAERTLTVADFDAVGGFQEALTRHANEAFSDQADSACIVRNLFVCLSRREASGQIVRRDATLAEVAGIAGVDPEDVYPVVRAFQENHRHFIVSSPSGNLSPDTVLDISHEALLRQWEKLVDWIEEESMSATNYLWLVDNARRKGGADFDPLRDHDLERALRWRESQNPNTAWAERYDGEFDKTIAYLDASQTAEVDRIRKEKNRRILLRGTGAFVLAVFAMLTLWALWAQDDAKRQLNSATSRQIAFASATVEGADGMLSLLLAIEAVETEHTPEAIKELYDSLTASNERLAIRHPQTVLYAAWNASGDRILTYCQDQKARLWSYDGEQIRVKLISEQDEVSGATWDSRGTKVRIEKTDGVTLVLDGDGNSVGGETLPPDSDATGWPSELKPLQEQVERSISESLGKEIPIEYIRGHLQEVSNVFPYPSVPTSKIERVLTVSDDNTGRVWTVGGEQKTVLRGHSGSVLHGAWHPSGKHVITASKDATVRIWEVDVLLDRLPMLSPDPNWTPGTASWSPDGNSVLKADDKGELRLYRNVSSQSETYLRLAGHRGKVGRVDWYPNDGLAPPGKILTTDSEGRSCVWVLPQQGDPSDGILEPVVTASSSAALGTSGALVDLPRNSGELSRYVDFGKEPEILSLPAGSTKFVFARFSPDGQYLLLADDDGDVRLYLTAAKLEAHVSLIGHQENILDVDWQQGDGEGEAMTILTTSFDQIPRVWNIPPRSEFSADDPPKLKPELELRGHRTAVVKGQWKLHEGQTTSSPEASYEPSILTVGAGGTACLWDGHGTNVAILGAGADKVRDASWTKDGDIRVIHPDGSSRIWPGTVEKLLEQARARGSWLIDIDSERPEGDPLALTEEERRLYID